MFSSNRNNGNLENLLILTISEHTSVPQIFLLKQVRILPRNFSISRYILSGAYYKLTHTLHRAGSCFIRMICMRFNYIFITIN